MGMPVGEAVGVAVGVTVGLDVGVDVGLLVVGLGAGIVTGLLFDGLGLFPTLKSWTSFFPYLAPWVTISFLEFRTFQCPLP